MAPSTVKQLDTLIRSIRYSFNALKTLADGLHIDVGVTAAMRAVLESLAEQGPQTVPQIAFAKSVSRQHIQTLVDELLDQKLVSLSVNPAHRRSPLVAMTAAGQTTFKSMRVREAEALKRIAADLPERELAVGLKLMSRLQAKLKDQITTTSKKKRSDDDA